MHINKINYCVLSLSIYFLAPHLLSILYYNFYFSLHIFFKRSRNQNLSIENEGYFCTQTQIQSIKWGLKLNLYVGFLLVVVTLIIYGKQIPSLSSLSVIQFLYLVFWFFFKGRGMEVSSCSPLPFCLFITLEKNFAKPTKNSLFWQASSLIDGLQANTLGAPRDPRIAYF